MFDGFVHAEAGRLLDGRNEPVLLRGVGLGNWLLPEGYMWKFDAASVQSPRQIEALVSDLVGQARADIFWSEFRDRFIAEADIAQIAVEGMNHVRLPINARGVMDDDGALLPEGLAPIDRLIGWCRAHGLWVVLDLHGAPGGQTGTNIDDSPNGVPELFTDSRYREQTIALWEALARRCTAT
jgi:aryl-phospho-beta-D-glucosidase BglC (GH1 family)